MSTNLNLMVQANNGGPADPKNWEFDTEILVSVIPFLQHLGVNPETDAGTVGRLIDSDANDVRGREAAIHRLTGYLVMTIGQSGRAFGSEERFARIGFDSTKIMFIEILASTLRYLSQTDGETFMYHVRLQWA